VTVQGAELRRRTVSAGLIAGIVVIYLAIVGMIETFDARHLIHDVVNLSHVMLCLPAFLGGFLVVRPRVKGGEAVRPVTRDGLVAGVAAGAIAGSVVLAGVVLTRLFRSDPAASIQSVRDIFISVSPRLLGIVTFGRINPLVIPPVWHWPMAAAVLVLGGAAMGLLGSLLGLAGRRYRRPLVTGLSVTFGFAVLQRVIPNILDKRSISKDWLYSTRFDGLTRLGAVVVFVVATGLAGLWAAKGKEVRERLRPDPQEGRRALGGLGLVAGMAAIAMVPFLLSTDRVNALDQVAVFVLMGLGLNIVVGYAGLLDLGYVAFFAVGAYLTALFTGAHVVTSLGATADPDFVLHLNFYAAVPLVILVAAFVGVMIGAPVLRLRGDYLAIVTLGFGEIARVLIISDWLRPVVGGAQGLRDVTDARIAGFDFRDPAHFYWLALFFIIGTIYVSSRLANSRVGRAWNAMREDEQVAEAMGISTIKYKLLAFAIGASIGCLSGSLFAVRIGSLTGATFVILVSITVLAVIILGGMGSIPGVIVGGLVLIGLPEFLSEFEAYKLLIYGAALIGIMILRPQGLIPNVRRMRELHEEEVEQDAWANRAGDASVDAAIVVGTGGGGPGAGGGAP
jgi:branched-chain amino acid transport system permease protein